jgi:hypothetical protein
MEIDYLIKKLNEQKLKVNTSETEVWLQTTYSLIEEYFRSYSPRASSFHSLIQNYRMKQIVGIKDAEIESLEKKALEYIDEIIIYLEEFKNRNSQKPIEKKESPTQNFVPPKTIIREEVIIKTQLPFGIKAEFFWAIFATLISGAFILGMNIGNSKFDKEKSDFYEENKILKQDIIKLKQKLIEKDKLISKKNDTIIIKQDSLKEANQNLNNLYLLLGNMKNKEK